MKYEPNLPKKNVNISHERPFREFLTLFIGVIVFLFISYQVLNFLVDIAIDNLSIKLERKLFSSIGDDIFKNYESDKRVQKMLDGLGKCANISYPLKVKIKDDETSNAFAFPGGQIVVFSNLIKTSKSQNGLAFVLAHEIGHFKNRDHLRMMGKSFLFSLIISSITGYDLDSTLSPLAYFAQMKYSQSHETQADRVALDILNCYYGHVGGATEFFKSISKDEKDLGFVGYFSTHPQTKERINNIKNLISKKGYKVQKTTSMWEDSNY